LEKLRTFSARAEIEITENSPAEVCWLDFQKIENGVLRGKSGGEPVRIFLGEKNWEILNEQFSVDLSEILPMLKKLPAPADSNFVASQRGKYFFPLDSPRAFLIAGKNRVFFPDKKSAIDAGFSPEN